MTGAVDGYTHGTTRPNPGRAQAPAPAGRAWDSPSASAPRQAPAAAAHAPSASPVANKAREIAKEITHDAREVPQVLRGGTYFSFMRADAHCIHGLQHWSKEEWKIRLLDNLEPHGQAFLDQFLRSTPSSATTLADSAEEGAKKVVEKLAQSLQAEEWQSVVAFQQHCLNVDHEPADVYYADPQLLSNFILEREFPLGVEEALLIDDKSRNRFAIKHSGFAEVRHRNNRVVDILLVVLLSSMLILLVCMLLYFMIAKSDLWSMEGTSGDPTAPGYTAELNARTKDRGTVASMLSAITFSLTINACLDKYGLIDPSTSTVFVGMLLGNTWGFVLDNMLGSDEGFREYLWSPQMGMRYAMGALGTGRFGRYLITIIFDMFFTVILFRQLYVKIVRIAGFSVKGREWIANGMASTIISVATYQVYSNMTRFEWAYPSGVESTFSQWISGSTMVLATVIMNMVYLVNETRSKIGEPGINDPPVKLLVTCVTFLSIFALNSAGVIDPSTDIVDSTNSSADDISLPLRGVCFTQSRFARGLGVFVLISAGSLAFVIFITSRQTVAGLRSACGRPTPLPAVPSRADLLKCQLILYSVSLLVVVVVVIFFSFVPFYSHDGERQTDGWQDACTNYDKEALAALGLS